MELKHRTVLGEDGEPEAVIIPWEVFLNLKDLLEDVEPQQDEIDACLEAEKDRREGNDGAFSSLADVKAELGV